MYARSCVCHSVFTPDFPQTQRGRGGGAKLYTGFNLLSFCSNSNIAFLTDVFFPLALIDSTVFYLFVYDTAKVAAVVFPTPAWRVGLVKRNHKEEQ